LGKGAFGIVYKAKWRGRDVAVKEARKEMDPNLEGSGGGVSKFLEEAEIMKKMQPHPNIVLFLGIVKNPLCIVTEFCAGGSLLRLLESDAVISDDMKLKWLTDVAAGMYHLALDGWIHRDLAARNILLTNAWDAKVADFGLSRITTKDEAIYSTSDVGPLKWMAPECLKSKKYSEKSDVWAFGVLSFEIYNREPGQYQKPYPSSDPVQVAIGVADGTLKLELPKNKMSPQIFEICQKCLTFEFNQRPSFEKIVAHLEFVNKLLTGQIPANSPPPMATSSLKSDYDVPQVMTGRSSVDSNKSGLGTDDYRFTPQPGSQRPPNSQ